jgi:rhodanese-related sulfurtransferase
MLDDMIQTITPQQAEQLFERGEVDIVDVREPGEWSQGHIAGARLVPLGQLRASPKRFLHRDNVVFVCAAGVRSQTAAKVAEALGFQQLFNLAGGTRAWVSAGLPLVTEAAVVAA